MLAGGNLSLNSNRRLVVACAVMVAVLVVVFGGSVAVASAAGKSVVWEQGTSLMPSDLNGVVAISGGHDFSLAVKSDGTVVGWADNTWGSPPPPRPWATIPNELKDPSTARVAAVAASHGGESALALRTDGTLIPWGNVWCCMPAGLTGIKGIAVGGAFQVAINADGTLVAWGDNYTQQVSGVQGITHVTSVAAGWNHGVALKDDGTVATWGRIGCGCPDGSWPAAVFLPSQLTDPNAPDQLKVMAIAAGGGHGLAVRRNGTVVAWGTNDAGQTNVPADLQDPNTPDASKAVAVAAGRYHSLALRKNGTVVAWGCGLGGNGQCLVPAGLTNVMAVTAGDGHSLALIISDTTPPTTSAVLSGNRGSNGWWTGPVTVTLNAMDEPGGSGVASTSYSVDGAAVQTYVSPFAVSTNGPHVVTFHSVDKAGNLEVDKTASFNIDQTPPTTTAQLSGPAGKNGWYTGPVTVTLIATDNLSGIASTSYSLDRAPSQSYSGPFIISANLDHSLAFSSIDQAGNTEATNTIGIKIDSAPPVTTLAPAAPSQELLNVTATVMAADGTVVGPVTVRCWIGTQPGVALSAVDNPGGSGVMATTYALNGGAAQTYTSPIRVAQGLSKIAYYSTDVAGNQEAAHTDTLIGDGISSACVVAPSPTLPLPTHGTLAITGQVQGLPFSTTIPF